MANLEHPAGQGLTIRAGAPVLLAIALGTWALWQRGSARDSEAGERRLPRAYVLQSADAAAGAAASPEARQKSAPAKGAVPTWTATLWRLYEEIGTDRILAVAAGVTFYVLLAVFPAIVALISIYGLFADASTIGQHVALLSGVLPDGAIAIIHEQISRIAGKGAGVLGYAFALGLAIAIWSANAGMKALFDALNVVYGETETRGLVQLTALSLLFTLGGLLFAMVAMAGVVGVPVVLNLIGLASDADRIVDMARWPAMFVLITLGLMLVYRFGPCRSRPPVRRLLWGSMIAALAWIGASMLFSWYVARFGSYNETYGSLGAVIGFMTWIWISTIVVLLGGEMNQALEDRALHRPAS